MKNLKTILISVLCICIICFSTFISVKKVTKGVKKNSAGDYKMILELWTIDTFEGGTGSRQDFLSRQALKFEKQNKGIIISVINHTLESAENALKSTTPDLISCGNGLSTNKFRTIPMENVYKNTYFNNKNYGISWCRGGYILIGESLDLVISSGENNLSLNALKEIDKTFNSIEILPPLKAYMRYLKGGVALLGTQRDVYRLANKGLNYEYTVIPNYTDLLVNIYLTADDEKKQEYAKKFMAYLQSRSVQQELNSIGMLPVIDIKIYNSGVMQDLQKVNPTRFTSIFYSRENLDKINKELVVEFKDKIIEKNP